MKSAFESRHVKSVRAWALLHQGKEAGKVVAVGSDNPNGVVWTCTIVIFAGPLHQEEDSSRSGRAGGYGYCKFSAAFYEALTRAPKGEKPLDGQAKDLSSRGEEAVASYLAEKGYQVIRVLG